jgi:hypothetical protein
VKLVITEATLPDGNWCTVLKELIGRGSVAKSSCAHADPTQRCARKPYNGEQATPWEILKALLLSFLPSSPLRTAFWFLGRSVMRENGKCFRHSLSAKI